jgi:hypothetical protein
MNKQYMVLDAIGNPIMRDIGDEANPYIFHDLIEACKFADSEARDVVNRHLISVVELKEITHKATGM